jgi:hypothetical protein
MAIDSEENTDLPSANVRAASYYIARTHIRCPHCGVNTQLTGVALAPDHETFDDEAEAWQSVAANAFLFNIQAVSCPVYSRLSRAAPNLCFASCFWLNHCEHCRRELADHEVHGEPGRGFTPLNEDDAANILLTEIAEPFEALTAGYSLEPDFFAGMRRG